MDFQKRTTILTNVDTFCWFLISNYSSFHQLRWWPFPGFPWSFTQDSLRRSLHWIISWILIGLKWTFSRIYGRWRIELFIGWSRISQRAPAVLVTGARLFVTSREMIDRCQSSCFTRLMSLFWRVFSLFLTGARLCDVTGDDWEDIKVLRAPYCYVLPGFGRDFCLNLNWILPETVS